MLMDPCVHHEDRSGPSTSRVVNRQIIQLRRLLHCIERTNSDADVHILHLTARMDYARQLFRELQDDISSFRGGKEDEALAALMDDLGNSIQHACTRTYLEISRRRSLVVDKNRNMDEVNSFLQGDDTNVLHDIFFNNLPRKHAEPQRILDESEGLHGGNATNKMKLASEEEYQESSDYQPEAVVLEPLHTSAVPKKKTNISHEEVVTSLETSMEEEIAEMAQQLKLSTLSVNETLRNQTKDLSSMEYLVSQNLESVTNVTDKVTEQVRRRRWSKQVGTWALYLAILATFCTTFMIVRVIPKRQRRQGREKLSEQSVYRSSRWKQYQRPRKDPFVDDTNAARNDYYSGTTMCNSRTTSPHCSNYDTTATREIVTTEDPDDLLWELIWEKKLEKIAANTASASADESPIVETITEKDRYDASQCQLNHVNDARCSKSDETLVENEKDRGTENVQKEHGKDAKTDNQESTDHESTEDDNNERLSALLRYAAATSYEDVFNIIDRCREKELLDDTDENGWTALHEAVRRGDDRVVETLLTAGADATLPTNFGEGYTPLQLALSIHGEEHSVSKILRNKERMDDIYTGNG